jgi:thiamin-phosphate kinase
MTPIFPSILIDEIRKGNCVLFIGAGLSIGAGLPSWEKLIRPLASEINLEKDVSLLKVAQYYENKSGRHALISKILDALDTTHIEPSNSHNILVDLPINTWITTNYDDLLERTLIYKKRQHRVVIYNQNLPYISADKISLIKMHGDVRDQSSIIITENDYRNFFKENSLVTTKLANLITEKTFLFVGYSIQDPDFNQLHDEIYSDLETHGRRAFAILFNANQFEIDDLSRRNIDVINIETRAGQSYEHCLYDTLNKLLDQINESIQKDITHLFFSYDWADRSKVSNLVQELRSLGVSISWDQDWPHWKDFNEEIAREIEYADIILVYSTFNSLRSQWVKSEVDMARIAGKRILVLNLEPDKLAEFIRTEDKITITGDQEQDANLIIQELELFFKKSEDEILHKNASVADLLQAANKANLNISSDTILDKIFVSPEAAQFIEKAYEKALEELNRDNSDRLRATLEYGRLQRFQGNWGEATNVFGINKGFAVDNPELYPHFCLELGAIEFESGKTKIGLELVKEGLGYFQRRGITPDLVKALRQLGNMLGEQSDWEETTRRLSAAMYLAEYLKSGDISTSEEYSQNELELLWIDCVRERASLDLDRGDVKSALSLFLNALEETENGGKYFEYLRGILCYHLGRIYLDYNHDQKKATEYLSISLEILHKYDNPVRLAFLYHNIGDALIKSHSDIDFEAAQWYLEKARRIRKECGHAWLEAQTELSIGGLYRKKGELNEAIKWIKSACTKNSRLGKRRPHGESLLALGVAYVMNGQPQKGSSTLRQAERTFKEVEMDTKIRETKFELMQLRLHGDLRYQSIVNIIEMGKREQYDFHLNEVGEYEFHKWIKNLTSSGIPDKPFDLNKLIKVNIGDDAAIMSIPKPESYDIVLTTDAAPGSICRSTEIDMGKYAARFSIVHCISDILAMGAIPLAVLLNLYLLHDATLEYAKTVIETVMKEANRYGATLIGGDMKERREQSVGCVGIGIVEKGKGITRGGAKPGQVVAITLAGLPDGSGVRKIGLRWAQEVIAHFKLTDTSPYSEFFKENWKEKLLFLSYKEMLAGAKTGLIRSAIDTSDGFLSCLQIMGWQSEKEVNFVIEEALVEEIVDDRVKEIADRLGLRPAQFLFNAGHDWEIVLTVEESDFEPLRNAFRNVGGDLARLGVVREKTDKLDGGIGFVSSKTQKMYWVPFFTDEKFVRVAYEDRPTQWEDLKYYLEGARELGI